MTSYDCIWAWPNLLLAWRRASRGKRGQAAVAAFEHRLEEHLLALQSELAAHAYRPGPYNSFSIHEPKRRLISAAPFRDRVVHHALCNVTAPLLERTFVEDSFANRVGKGTHRALDRCQHFARRYAYVLGLDVRQFFPSIDHAVLRDRLARTILDAQVMGLIDLILASGRGVLADEYDMVYFPGDDLWARARPRGLPIGNLTSQLWANCHLNPFDHFVKRELRCPGYVRYVDDLLLFADEKARLWEWKAEAEARLARLRLTVHPGAQPRRVEEGISFLGFRVFPHRRRLKRRKGVHFQRKLREMLKSVADGTLAPAEVTTRVRAWVNHVRFANTVGLRKAVLGQGVPRDQKT